MHTVAANTQQMCLHPQYADCTHSGTRPHPAPGLRHQHSDEKASTQAAHCTCQAALPLIPGGSAEAPGRLDAVKVRDTVAVSLNKRKTLRDSPRAGEQNQILEALGKSGGTAVFSCCGLMRGLVC